MSTGVTQRVHALGHTAIIISASHNCFQKSRQVFEKMEHLLPEGSAVICNYCSSVTGTESEVVFFKCHACSRLRGLGSTAYTLESTLLSLLWVSDTTREGRSVGHAAPKGRHSPSLTKPLRGKAALPETHMTWLRNVQNETRVDLFLQYHRISVLCWNRAEDTSTCNNWCPKTTRLENGEEDASSRSL